MCRQSHAAWRHFAESWYFVIDPTARSLSAVDSRTLSMSAVHLRSIMDREGVMCTSLCLLGFIGGTPGLLTRPCSDVAGIEQRLGRQAPDCTFAAKNNRTNGGHLTADRQSNDAPFVGAAQTRIPSARHEHELENPVVWLMCDVDYKPVAFKPRRGGIARAAAC
jgi:hypothetical protein